MLEDARIARMAKVLVEYSLEVKPGWMVTISSTTAAVPLVQAVYGQVLAVGGHPYVLMEPPGVKDLLIRTGSDEHHEQGPTFPMAEAFSGI